MKTSNGRKKEMKRKDSKMGALKEEQDPILLACMAKVEDYSLTQLKDNLKHKLETVPDGALLSRVNSILPRMEKSIRAVQTGDDPDYAAKLQYQTLCSQLAMLRKLKSILEKDSSLDQNVQTSKEWLQHSLAVKKGPADDEGKEHTAMGIGRRMPKVSAQNFHGMSIPGTGRALYRPTVHMRRTRLQGRSLLTFPVTPSEASPRSSICSICSHLLDVKSLLRIKVISVWMKIAAFIDSHTNRVDDKCACQSL